MDECVKMVSFANQVDNGDKSRTPFLGHSCFQRERRNSKNGMSTYIEKFVYSRKKTCVKRKLRFRFDDNGEDAMNKSKKKKHFSENKFVKEGV
ncbi:unnamed protein product [Trifolium pratense]|uniref:Uncharacterized protein n=1 Tax=Trifolium pratense TaxID=57577 RepID=A0ACB0M5R2_TRIPR|nr:unnamed protein product [Trifolium pratense]